ncbi:MAG: hypothetical protein HZB50_14850 [Chloroflexi bacterium]|nr:hypothetical protein [Chloroflexota bacterium]
MNHPLEIIPQNLRKPMFFVFLALTVLIFGIFRPLDRPLRTDAAPIGIVSFELAGNPNTSQAIIDSWDAHAWLYASFGLGFDYLFMPVYALALSLGLLLAMNGKTGWYASASAWLGWGALAAPLFDAVENFALWKELTVGVFSPYPQLAAFCASVKFTLLIVGLVTALAGGFLKKK